MSLSIVNTSGRTLYHGNHRVGSNTASLSIPLSFLPSGYYIASAVFHENNRRISSSNFHFVLTE